MRQNVLTPAVLQQITGVNIAGELIFALIAKVADISDLSFNFAQTRNIKPALMLTAP